MSKATDLLELFFSEKMQNELEPKIDQATISKLYSLKTSPEYPQAFDKTYTVKDIKGDMAKEELVFVVIDKDTDKPKMSLPLKIVGVSKKAVGMSDPTQSDQLRSYIPKVQMLVRGAYKDKDKTVVVVEAPSWVLKNISNKGIKVQ